MSAWGAKRCRGRRWAPPARARAAPGAPAQFPAARAAALPGQAAARRAGPDCASAAWAGGLRPPPQECLGGSLVFGVSWISPGLTWPHLPPCLLTTADRPTLPWRLWVLASCPSSCPSGRRMRGPAAPCPLLGGQRVLQRAGQEGVALWLRSRPGCCPPHRSPVAAAPGAGGTGRVERAGGQGRDEKALHSLHKGRLCARAPGLGAPWPE